MQNALLRYVIDISLWVEKILNILLGQEHSPVGKSAEQLLYFYHINQQ